MDLLRQIETEIKPEWDNLKVTKKVDYPFEDCEPNMLIGWTDKNTSIWDVSGDTNKPTLEKILVALCRRKREWNKIAYLKFKKKSVEKAKLSLTGTNGNTSDQRIDTSNTHYEIQGITAKQLSTLIYYIAIDQFETGIFKKSDYDKILIEAYEKIEASQITSSSTSAISEIPISAASSTEDKEKTRVNMAEIQPESPIMNMANSGTKQ
ncbi:MAG: hypothetical protein HQ534_03490 [Armatimonadetes bacterium]|nr:hypothetical protein [Armatimonadota bacterium]